MRSRHARNSHASGRMTGRGELKSMQIKAMQMKAMRLETGVSHE